MLNSRKLDRPVRLGLDRHVIGKVLCHVIEECAKFGRTGNAFRWSAATFRHTFFRTAPKRQRERKETEQEATALAKVRTYMYAGTGWGGGACFK